MEYICNICKEEFENHSKKANHIRWKHKSEEFRQNCIEKMSKRKLEFDTIQFGKFEKFTVNCDNCNKSFIITERLLKFPSKEKYFCCRSCANTRNHNTETKNKISEKVKNKWKDEDYYNKCILNFKCNKRSSSCGEREIRYFLKDRYGYKNVLAHRNINIGLTDKKSVDITIKDKNIIIEYDGIWHFNKEIYERMGTPNKYFEVIEKDRLLNDHCLKNNIKLLRISEKYYLHNKRKSIEEIINLIENIDFKYIELY